MSAEAMLLEAFSGFSRAAESLEVSYRDLSGEVARLREELEERNAQLEHSLAENEKIRGELEKILANLPCGVLVSDESGTIRRSNAELARVLHLAEVGHEIGDLPEAVRAILGRVENETGEAECSPGGGGENWLAIRRAALAAGREPGKMIFIVRDISAQKRWEKERERERHGVALGEMAALLAHEIRNPLASLELFAGLLADEQLPGDAGRWVNHVQAGLRTLGTTVNSVLDFHHPGTSEPSALDLGEFVDQVHAFLQPLGDRQVPGQDDVADVRLGRGLADEQQIVERVVDEIEVPLDVVPVDVDAAGGAEEALELGKAHHGHRGCLLSIMMSTS